MARFNKKPDGECRVALSVRVSPETVAAIRAIADEIQPELERERGKLANMGRGVDEMARRAAARATTSDEL